MFGAAQMTMRRERPVEPRCARGCRGVTPVSGLPGSPTSKCPARERASRRGSNRLPGSDRRRCHRGIEQHLPTGAIAQEAYRKYTLTSSNRTTTAVELVGTSNKSECTRGQKCLRPFNEPAHHSTRRQAAVLSRDNI